MLDHPLDRASLDPLMAGHLTAEQKAIVAGVRNLVPQTDTLDWELVGHLALAHGVAPLLHQAWKGAAGSIPLALLARLEQVRQQTLRYGVVGMWQRDDVVETLQRAGVPCLVLKGAALARYWYGDLSLRSFSDIDLLLALDDIDRGRQALLAAGYEAVPGGPGPHHDVPLRHASLPCAVELHHHLTGIPFRYDLSFEELNARSMAVTMEGSQVRTLGPEDTLLHLCMHMMSHVVMDQGWRLRHVCDIQRHVLTNAVDWGVFLERTTALGVRRACGGILGVTSALTGLDLPSNAVDVPAAQALLQQGPAAQWDADIQHSGLYEFIAVLAVGDVRRALAMVARDRVGIFDIGFGATEAATRPQRWRRRTVALLGQVRRLVQEARRDPIAVSRQFRAGVGHAYRRQQQRRMVVDLLSDL
jgi:Uncharacterised nucleotidyltransferase